MEKILLLGSGARESALAWSLLRSPQLETLFTAPGTYPEAIHATGLDTHDFGQIREFITKHGVTMVVPGPEDIITEGLADALADLPVRVVAPDSNCARLEADKEFAKEFMSDNGIPTPRWMSVTAETLDEGLSFLNSIHPPYVLKANGLASGTGVRIIESLPDATDILKEMLDGLYGDASKTVIIEEFVPGRECSVFLAVNGEEYKLLGTARDYKRVGNGDRGPNTRGMGSVSPAPFEDSAFIEKVEQTIVRPTLSGLTEAGLSYRGFLYLGIIEIGGIPLLLEYNVRLGDPETQAMVLRLETDPIDILRAISDNSLDRLEVNMNDNTAVSVVMVSPGYPGVAETGNHIGGFAEARKTGAEVFPGHIGKDGTGNLVTLGGRLATVAAAAPTLGQASDKVYEAISHITSPGAFYRSDIGRG